MIISCISGWWAFPKPSSWSSPNPAEPCTSAWLEFTLAEEWNTQEQASSDFQLHCWALLITARAGWDAELLQGVLLLFWRAPAALLESHLGQRRWWLSGRRTRYHRSGSPAGASPTHPGFWWPHERFPSLGSALGWWNHSLGRQRFPIRFGLLGYPKEGFLIVPVPFAAISSWQVYNLIHEWEASPGSHSLVLIYLSSTSVHPLCAHSLPHVLLCFALCYIEHLFVSSAASLFLVSVFYTKLSLSLFFNASLSGSVFSFFQE